MRKIFVFAIGFLMLCFRYSAARTLSSFSLAEQMIHEEEGEDRSSELERKQGEIAEVIEYSGGGYENPFKLRLPQKTEVEEVINVPDRRGEELPQLDLKGIVWGGIYPQAIINGAVVKAGDKIEGVEVLKISKDGVKLSYGESTFFLGAEDGSNDKVN